jgi:hypothetical protein
MHLASTRYVCFAPNGDDSLRQLRKYLHSPRLSEEMRIMAAQPQLGARESNKQREMILCQINEMAPAGGIS